MLAPIYRRYPRACRLFRPRTRLSHRADLCIAGWGRGGAVQTAGKPANQLPEALFFGTFIGLQGATYIAEAVGLYQGPVCRRHSWALGLTGQPARILWRVANPNVQVAFEEWVPLTELPERIGAADLCLGVFGIGDKTNRVIPNKVYQSLACDRPVITMAAQAYPEALRSQSGVLWAAAGDPASIAKALSDAFSARPLGGVEAGVAFATYEKHFFQPENPRRTLGVTDSAGLAPEDRSRCLSASWRPAVQRRL